MLTAKREFSVTGLRNHEYYLRRRGQNRLLVGRGRRGVSPGLQSGLITRVLAI
jgi:hypothetical protein